MIKFYDMNLCDDGWWRNDVRWWLWNYVVLFCVDTVMKWYEMLWKWTVVNDEMIEVDDMNLGVFVSSYIAKASRRPGLSIGISEAKLVWGVWGGEALIRLRFGKVRPEPAWGELQKTRPHFPRFWRLKENLHFGHFWLFSDVFLTFFMGCQKPKHCNLQCFWAFGMEKVLLATRWKLCK